MNEFDYVRPSSMAAAFRCLERPGAKVLAGGTSVSDLMKLGVEQPCVLVDISALPLKDISVNGESLYIGALASNSEVAMHPLVQQHLSLVSEALLSGASTQIRNAASIAGNLMQRTRCSYFRDISFPCNKRRPGSGCSALKGVNTYHAILGTSEQCIAVSPSDLAVSLCAVDAYVHVESVQGGRRIALSKFFTAPGVQPQIENSLRPGEIVTFIEIPDFRRYRRSAYLKVRARASYEFATVSVAAATIDDSSRSAGIVVALGGVGTVPWRSRQAEATMQQEICTDAVLATFCDLLMRDADCRPATAFKLPMARTAIMRCIKGLVA